jgi:hypothetical protein
MIFAVEKYFLFSCIVKNGLTGKGLFGIFLGQDYTKCVPLFTQREVEYERV